jgi:hypothetical protein
MPQPTVILVTYEKCAKKDLKMAHSILVILNEQASGGKRLLTLWLYKHKHSLKGDIYKTLNYSYMIMGKVVG